MLKSIAHKNEDSDRPWLFSGLELFTVLAHILNVWKIKVSDFYKSFPPLFFSNVSKSTEKVKNAKATIKVIVSNKCGVV